jgi:hypothetical protein
MIMMKDYSLLVDAGEDYPWPYLIGNVVAADTEHSDVVLGMAL